MRTALLVAAIILAVIAAALGFGWVTTDEPGDVLGWLALSLAVFFAAHVVPD